ncbi:hypothetical protein DFH11DRAFT_1548335 [Phellopilus nigrolimitatus]|nr:hypothetical protein DFH11DRAFT_1548335 [Phellopilus nigrolimitatus]
MIRSSAHRPVVLASASAASSTGGLTAFGTIRRQAATDVLRALVASGFEADTTEVVLGRFGRGLQAYAADPKSARLSFPKSQQHPAVRCVRTRPNAHAPYCRQHEQEQSFRTQVPLLNTNSTSPATPVASITAAPHSSAGSAQNQLPAGRQSALLGSTVAPSGMSSSATSAGNQSLIPHQPPSLPSIEQREQCARLMQSGNEAQGKILLEQLMSGHPPRVDLLVLLLSTSNLGKTGFGDPSQGSCPQSAPLPQSCGPFPTGAYQARYTQEPSRDFQPQALRAQPKPPSPVASSCSTSSRPLTPRVDRRSRLFWKEEGRSGHTRAQTAGLRGRLDVARCGPGAQIDGEPYGPTDPELEPPAPSAAAPARLVLRVTRHNHSDPDPLEPDPRVRVISRVRGKALTAPENTVEIETNTYSVLEACFSAIVGGQGNTSFKYYLRRYMLVNSRYHGMVPLGEALQVIEIENDGTGGGKESTWGGQIDGDWTVFVLPNGGYSLGLMIESCIAHQKKHSPGLLDPIHVSAYYLRPTRPVRAEMVQRGQTTISARLIFRLLSPIKTAVSEFIEPKTLNPPSPYAQRTPLRTHPSNASSMPLHAVWNFKKHISGKEDKVLTNMNRPENRKFSSRSTAEVEAEITVRRTPASDIVKPLPELLPSEENPLQGKTWYATLTLSVEFKTPLRLYDFDPQQSFPHDTVRGEDWREKQRCLAIATQAAICVPYETQIVVENVRGVLGQRRAIKAKMPFGDTLLSQREAQSRAVMDARSIGIFLRVKEISKP